MAKKKKDNSLGVLFLNKKKERKLILSIVVLCSVVFALVFVETKIIIKNTQNYLDTKALADISAIDKGMIGLGGMMVKELKTINSGEPYRNRNIKNFVAHAKAIQVYDITTDKVLLDYNSTKILPMASLTKLMSTVVVDDNKNLVGDDDWLQFSLRDIEIEGKKNIFSVGEEYKTKDLISAALISSSNESISLLARSVEGVTESNFVKLMQDKAKLIGLKNTIFSNPIGFDGNHFSTAHDIILLLKWILNNKPQLLKDSIPLEKTIYSRTGKKVLVRNTDYMILDEFNDIIGSKTGHTDQALGCLAIIKKIKNDLIAFVILGSEHRTTEMRSLINWTQSAYIF